MKPYRAHFHLRAGNAAGLPAGAYSAKVHGASEDQDGKVALVCGEPEPESPCFVGEDCPTCAELRA